MKLLMCCAVLLVTCVYDTRGATKGTYKAAVVEYNVLKYDSIFDEVNIILADYVKKIIEAKKNDADIIVFPELTLNSRSPITVPDEEEKAQPWNEPDKYSKVLYQLSKAARDESIYVVVNVAEKALNETAESNENNYIIFNTNFVLDTNGTVISRYRKIHLFGEPGRTPSLDNKLGVFETNFGVKFGHFICFDLLFQQPAVQILNKENVSNIIFPAMWYSELPFLTAVQIQESWAYVHNVNLLAAGSNQPAVGSTGSGIYSGKRGKLTAVMHGTSTSQISYADVIKDPKSGAVPVSKTDKQKGRTTLTVIPSSLDNLYLMKYNLSVYNSVILDKSGEYSVSYGNVNCSVNITFLSEGNTGGQKYIYRTVAYDGIRWFTFVTGGVSDCGVVACTDTEITSCATRFKNYSQVWPRNTISSIELHAIVPVPVWNETMTAENIVYHPVTLDTSIMPLSIDDYDYTVTPNKEGYQEIVMKITQVETHDDILLSFGITGRVFERDGLTNKGTVNITEMIMVMVALAVSIYALCYK